MYNYNRDDILNKNKILYTAYHNGCEASCMCWGLEIPDAWLRVVSEMSEQLEGVNYMVYPHYRVRIQMEQVKSKYGTLRAYYSIIQDPPFYIKFYEDCVDKIVSFLNNINYKLKRVVDEEACDKEYVDEITKEQYERESSEEYKANHLKDVVLWKDGDKFFKKYKVHCCQRIHFEPTRFKTLYKLFRKKYSIKYFLRGLFDWNPSHKQECISRIIDQLVENVIKDATDNCANYCEECGTLVYENGTFSPRCWTYGWRRILCKKCAIESGSEYECLGEKWIGTEKITD